MVAALCRPSPPKLGHCGAMRAAAPDVAGVRRKVSAPAGWRAPCVLMVHHGLSSAFDLVARRAPCSLRRRRLVAFAA